MGGVREAELRRRSREVEFVNVRLSALRVHLLELLDQKTSRDAMKAEIQRQKAIRLAKEVAMKGLSEAEQEAQVMADCFEAFDIDGTGTIDELEFGLMIKDLKIPLKPARIKEEFAFIDSDGSGEITFKEFKSWWTYIGSPKKSRAGKLRMLHSDIKTKYAKFKGEADLKAAKRSQIRTTMERAAEHLRTAFRKNEPVLFELSPEEINAIESGGKGFPEEVEVNPAVEAAAGAAEAQNEGGADAGLVEKEDKLIKSQAQAAGSISPALLVALIALLIAFLVKSTQ